MSVLGSVRAVDFLVTSGVRRQDDYSALGREELVRSRADHRIIDLAEMTYAMVRAGQQGPRIALLAVRSSTR